DLVDYGGCEDVNPLCGQIVIAGDHEIPEVRVVRNAEPRRDIGGIAAEHFVPSAERVVDFDEVLIVVDRVRAGIAEVDAREGIRKIVLCLRPVIQKGLRRRNDARLRNYVTGKWSGRCWVRGRINDSDGGERRPGCTAPIQQGAEVTV